MTTTTPTRIPRSACEQLAREYAALEADFDDFIDYAFDDALETRRLELLALEAAAVCVETKREN